MKAHASHFTSRHESAEPIINMINNGQFELAQTLWENIDSFDALPATELRKINKNPLFIIEGEGYNKKIKAVHPLSIIPDFKIFHFLKFQHFQRYENNEYVSVNWGFCILEMVLPFNCTKQWKEHEFYKHQTQSVKNKISRIYKKLESNTLSMFILECSLTKFLEIQSLYLENDISTFFYELQCSYINFENLKFTPTGKRNNAYMW